VLGSAGCASSRVVENSNGHGKGSSIVSDELIVITECEFKQVEGDRTHNVPTLSRLTRPPEGENRPSVTGQRTGAHG